MKIVKVLFITAIVCIMFNVALSINIYAASAKDDYELQEKCGKSASKYFNDIENINLSSKDFLLLKDFNNHYNKKLNKCFVLIIGKATWIKKKENETFQKLLDINENKEYGHIMQKEDVLECMFLDQACYSKNEWNSLIRPYLEE